MQPRLEVRPFAAAVALACIAGTAGAGRTPRPQPTRRQLLQARLQRVDRHLANLAISTTSRERAGSQPVDLHYWKFRDANEAAADLDAALAETAAEGLPSAPIVERARRLLGLMEPFLAQHFHVPVATPPYQVWQYTEAVNRLPLLRRIVTTP